MSQYKLAEAIGSGGFGVVHKAERVSDGSFVAIKRLNSSEPEALARFQREVRILNALDHPRIVRVITSQLSQAPYWFAMPLYDGSLRDLLPLATGTQDSIQHIVEQLLDEVEYAHQQGVIHRDLKPENLLYDDQMNIAISDFGLGRRMDSETTRKTFAGQHLGTAFYMAPEQDNDAMTVDHCADIYAIGRILYELYSGDPPAAQQDLEQISNPGMRHIVQKCTRSDPTRRYQSVIDIRLDFDLLCRGTVSDSLKETVQDILQQCTVSSGEAPSDLVAKLHEALVVLREDPEAVFEAFMLMPANLYSALEGAYGESTCGLIKEFCARIETESWPFSYCDQIARSLQRLIAATRSPEVARAGVGALLEMGVSHNRWAVWEVLRDVVAAIRLADQIFAVRDLFDERRDRVSRVRETLLKGALPEPIRVIVYSCV